MNTEDDFRARVSAKMPNRMERKSPGNWTEAELYEEVRAELSANAAEAKACQAEEQWTE